MARTRTLTSGRLVSKMPRKVELSPESDFLKELLKEPDAEVIKQLIRNRLMDCNIFITEVSDG